MRRRGGEPAGQNSEIQSLTDKKCPQPVEGSPWALRGLGVPLILPSPEGPGNTTRRLRTGTARL